jgi:outer membrane receptor protein involved in Fe transport
MQSNFGDAFPMTFDLDRIEVLRGPQGALLGEGTEGGAIRFTHNQPSLTTFTGQARAEVATTRYGAASHEAGLAGGGPLVEDKLGFRASVWERMDGGYIDRVNPFTGAVVDPNSNTQRSKSIRAALTWAPTASVRITASEMYQSISLHDTPVFYEYLSKPPQGIFRSGRLVRQPADDTFYLSDLKVTANLPFGTLSSDTSYFHRTATAVADITTIYCWVGGYCHNPLGREYPSSYTNALSSVVDLNGRTFIQELRLISPSPGGRFTWLVGAQYSNTSQGDTENDYNDVGILQPQQFRSYRGEEIQRAIYGEASIAILTRLGATLGLRIARDSYAWTSTPYAIDFTGDCCFAFSLSERDKPLAPKMSLTYTLDQDHLLYATAAKGNRMGGVNPQRLTACYAQPPQVFDPDSVWNYEVGSKNTVFNARLQLDASAFQMSWRNLQQAVDVPCYFGWNKNGARINGFDLTARAFLTQRLKVDLAVEYVDARFTETVSYQSRPLVAAGDSIGTLPQVPSPWSATTSLDYSLPLAGRPSVILHAENSIHTHNPGPFTRPLPVYAPNSADPTTSVLNLRATAAWSALNLSLFVDNALGSQPTLQRNSQAGVPGATLFFATTFRPRTVGISLNVRH